MKTQTLKTTVVLRRWRKRGSVIALFPYEPHDVYGLYCLSYERIGQHCGANYSGLISKTDPVRLDDPDVQDLIRELNRIGYDLNIVTKAIDHWKKRKAALKNGKR